MRNIKIWIDNGHGDNTPGKCSPDKKFREYAYNREIAAEVVNGLKKLGYDAELLVPTYGYCQIPPCQDFTQDVCTGFFDLPLYPSQQPVNPPTQCNL